MPDRDPHRDALEAAHARIETLEQLLAERRVQDADAHAAAALLRERADALARTTPPNVWRMLRYLFVVFPVVALAFAWDGDWLFGGLALVAPFGMGLVGQAVARGNAATAARQVALIDERLEEIQKRAQPS